MGLIAAGKGTFGSHLASCRASGPERVKHMPEPLREPSGPMPWRIGCARSSPKGADV
jgi:hypothetical protein